ncbi:trans-2,3-dihydro-3-hydroxyanthranilate isomerase [Devosia sp. YR412]|uniref:PhzF family phenazine biosynthesis protein n=1 Tax=Devosia sp. YR412 TaxID=1881030 RepID=UPI0008CCA274|nr:PhzF family phenazine biosynthesis protein [Devosia sp. YR412]SEP99949.1 trans-2,3-dihydro-3-hydroxyanthranilate isomerase [Devosia sp. YR412]
MKLNYLLLDVFTEERLKGNQLAVVCKADGLLDGEMQALAREFNLSETVFIQKAHAERNTASVRIFTPRVELPFAGHPTVGAAVVLGLQNKVSAVRLEEQIGLITALFEKTDKRSGEARFALPQLPARLASIDDRAAIALALGIERDEIGCGAYQPAVFSAGVAFHLVPVRDADVLKRIAPNMGQWASVFPHGRNSVYIFTQTPNEPDNDLAARMFAPGMGLSEDPGTGSAAAALIGLLAEHADIGTGQLDLVLRQGHEMGRPCRITLQLRKDNDVLTHGGIGGHAVIVAEGVLDLGD